MLTNGMNLGMERLLKDKHPLSVNALAAGTSVRNLYLQQKKEYCAIGIPDPKEKQEQDKGKHISKNIHQAPLHLCIREPGSENSIRKDFQKHYFENTEGLEELCRKNLKHLVGEAWFCADNTNNTSNDKVVEMFLNYGSNILGVLYKYGSSKAQKSNGRVAQTLIDMLEKQIPFPVLFELHKLKQGYGGDVSLLNGLILLVKNCFEIEVSKLTPLNADPLEDMLLLENQIPFFFLFELHKLKQDKGDDVALLKELIELVKNCYEIHVLKLTQPLLPCKYKPEKLPKHLLEVVYSLCIPTNTTRSDEYEKCGLVLQQINTATELEKNGVGFQKIEEVQSSLFGIDFNWGTMKIRRFRIDDFTETLLRNMIAYEQHSDVESKYFTDFVLFMSHLIDTSEDVKLLRGKGIIAIFPATDDKEKFFSQLLVGVNTSSTSTLSTLSGVINKVSQHCEKQLAIWLGMLRQDFTNSPWKPILGFIAVIAALIGIVHHIITSVKAH